jgi:magnesium-transporting ATPase (P-type)
VLLVSVLFAAITLGVFFAALGLGRDLETARTLVVNTLVLLQIAYLFNVRHLQASSATLRGVLGTPALLWAIGVVAAAQLAFTYAPFMQAWFQSRPVAPLDGAMVLACGIAFLLLLEAEKLLLRRLAVPAA